MEMGIARWHVIAMSKSKTRTYTVMVVPDVVFRDRFRWAVSSSDGTHTQYSEESYRTRIEAQVRGEAQAKELNEK